MVLGADGAEEGGGCHAREIEIGCYFCADVVTCIYS